MKDQHFINVRKKQVVMKRANEERPRTLCVWREHRAGHVRAATGGGGELVDVPAGCANMKNSTISRKYIRFWLIFHIKEQLDEFDMVLRSSLSRRKRF